ncbi:hypothetical protein R3P38DRAFT_2811333 [Favolaschia claudopus]|uniref:Uncharacterized protein n=1 Tax=Favolaschia claudopus TaxID=2862362 RepID=A0AAV9Z946_9AGAR
MHFVKSIAAVAVFVATATAVATKGKGGLTILFFRNMDHKVALSSAQYGNGEHRGKKSTVEYNGEGIAVEVRNLCPTCDPGEIGIDPRQPLRQIIRLLPLNRHRKPVSQHQAQNSETLTLLQRPESTPENLSWIFCVGSLLAEIFEQH